MSSIWIPVEPLARSPVRPLPGPVRQPRRWLSGARGSASYAALASRRTWVCGHHRVTSPVKSFYSLGQGVVRAPPSPLGRRLGSGTRDMTSKERSGNPAGQWTGHLRGAVLFALLVSAAGSLGLMLRAGRQNPSRLLLALFALWVLSPFLALVWANMVSRGWSALARGALYVVILVVILGSLAIYGAQAFGHIAAKTGFVFLAVPAASWLLIAVVVAMATMTRGPVSRQVGGG
jgi:hypothetical protein